MNDPTKTPKQRLDQVIKAAVKEYEKSTGTTTKEIRVKFVVYHTRETLKTRYGIYTDIEVTSL